MENSTQPWHGESFKRVATFSSHIIFGMNISFVECRRTPERAIQVSIRCHLADISLRDASKFLEKSGRSIGVTLPSTSGFAKQAYSRSRRSLRTNLRSTGKRSACTARTSGCTARSIPSERNIAYEPVSDGNETDDATVSGRSPSTLPARWRRVSRR